MVEGIELKLSRAVEDAYGQVSTKFGSKRNPRSLDTFEENVMLMICKKDNSPENRNIIIETWSNLKITALVEHSRRSAQRGDISFTFEQEPRTQKTS